MSKKVYGSCNYCGVGCSLVYHLGDDGKIEKVTGREDYPVNKGLTCPKGFKIHEPHLSEDRGKTPLMRKNGVFEAVSWDEAIGTFTDTVKEIQAQHGKKSVAFLSTGQLLTEEMAILGQVARTGMGIDGDGNTRQCMSSAVVGHKKTFGYDAPPFSYQDIEESDCVVVIGYNMAITHPIVWNRVKNNQHDPEIVVLDPRYSDTAKQSTFHVPITPKRDVIFLYLVMNKLIQDNCYDKEYVEAHTHGFEEVKKVMAQYDIEKVEELTGVSQEAFNKFVDLMKNKKRVSFWWAMGVNQSHVGTRTVEAILNLCLMTGNIGKPGAGPCSMTGQSNAMASRLFSNTTSLFAGRKFDSKEDREFVAQVFQHDASHFPQAPAMAYDKIVDEIEAGKIRGLWIICTNPLHSWINNTRLQNLAKNLDLLVVQDLYPTTLSAQSAHIYLPAAGIVEKEGLTINSERRLNVNRKAVTAPGEALSDFEIIKKIAKSYGCDDIIKGWDTPEAVFQLLKQTTKGTPCDFSGIKDYDFILEKAGIQWPYPLENPDESQERRLFSDGIFFTPDGKAKMFAAAYEDAFNEPTSEYPLYLLTGRGTIVQWQSNTRTEKSPILRKQMSEDLYAEINEEDALRAGVSTGEKIKISSKSHSIQVLAKIHDGIRKGYVFLPFHYMQTNSLIDDNFDPSSGQPAFKMGAVKFEKIS